MFWLFEYSIIFSCFYWPSNFIAYFIIPQICVGLHTYIHTYYTSATSICHYILLRLTFVVHVCCFCYYSRYLLWSRLLGCCKKRFLSALCNDFHLACWARHFSFFFDFQLTFICAFVLFGTFFKHTCEHYFHTDLFCSAHFLLYISDAAHNNFELYFHFKLSAVLSIKLTTTNSKQCWLEVAQKTKNKKRKTKKQTKSEKQTNGIYEILSKCEHAKQ